MSLNDKPLSTIAYLGPEASYTHQAALHAFPQHTLTAYTTISSIITTIQSGSIIGIVPIENSTNGPVSFTLDALAGPSAAATLRIVAEVRVAVRHCLVGRWPDASRSTIMDNGSEENERPSVFDPEASLPDLSHIREIHTHPQAWGQCTRFLSRLGIAPPGTSPRPTEDMVTSATSKITTHDATSTSSAAALAAANPSVGAISSRLAARTHGVDVLVEGIEDSKENVTRFFVIAPTSHPNFPRPVHLSHHQQLRKKGFVVFTLSPTSDGRPGALSDALGVFAERGLSLTSISSRPRGVPWAYTFCVEVDLGTVRNESSEGMTIEGNLGDVVTDLRRVVASADELGVWSWGVDCRA